MCVFIVMKEHVSQYNHVSLTDMIFIVFGQQWAPVGQRSKIISLPVVCFLWKLLTIKEM